MKMTLLKTHSRISNIGGSGSGVTVEVHLHKPFYYSNWNYIEIYIKEAFRETVTISEYS
jgi:hypothetical protein